MKHICELRKGQWVGSYTIKWFLNELMKRNSDMSYSQTMPSFCGVLEGNEMKIKPKGKCDPMTIDTLCRAVFEVSIGLKCLALP